jgi:hypothetical protein
MSETKWIWFGNGPVETKLVCSTPNSEQLPLSDNLYATREACIEAQIADKNRDLEKFQAMLKDGTK